MITIRHDLTVGHFSQKLARLWEVSAPKILSLHAEEKQGSATAVFTIKGKYTARGWTEWTQGFVYGSAILQYDATGDNCFLALGRDRIRERMAPHITHTGVHDHGFNNISTYGNLLRLMGEGRIPHDAREKDFYELALKCSGAVQASRWTTTSDGGYIYSFNGPHSLFADTIRSLRSLAVSHALGHLLMGEGDEKFSLLDRLLQHAKTTADFTVFYGENRDAYDIRGRVAHESIFNTNDGQFRCPNSQQGYSPFSTWTRGLAWIIVGYPEQLEWLDTLSNSDLEPFGGREFLEAMFLRPALAACDFYIQETPADGIPYWDTGAPDLQRIPDYLKRPAEIKNDFEPVDSSAAVIAAQGFLRLGRYLLNKGDERGGRYWQAGLTIADTVLSEPYLSPDENHQGLILHSIYHRPNGWDYIPEGSKIPYGEASMWGDYHARELALYLQRIIENKPYYTFFGGIA
jgi:hypothetical protein